MFVEKKLYRKAKEQEKHIKYTKRLLRSVGSKCEGSELELGHDAVVVVVPSGVETGPALWTHGNTSDVAFDILANSDDGEVVEDRNDVNEEILKQLRICQPMEELRDCPLWVNLAGRSVWNHPGQSEENLWMRHTTKKVDQHRQIISWMRQDVEVLIEAGTSLAVKKVLDKLDLCYEEYNRQVQEAEEVAKLMSSVDKKVMKDFSPSVALHAPLEET